MRPLTPNGPEPTGREPPSFWGLLEQFPPYYVRILAKNSGSGQSKDQAIEDAEIAIRMGVPITRVREIATSLDWRNITIGEMIDFTVACNFDPTCPKHRKRVRQYEYVCLKRKKTPFNYLRISPKWESEFLPLIRIMQARLSQPAA